MAKDTEGSVIWYFRLTKETYIISGQFNSISSYRGARYYDEFEPVKRVEVRSSHCVFKFS